MTIESSRRLTGIVVGAWLIAVMHGCGGGAATEPGESTDAGIPDSTTQADSEPSDTGPSVDSGESEGSALDSGLLDSGTMDTAAPDTGADADAGDGAACPQPHPMTCGTIIECHCVDGTMQTGGCPNGFTCPEACCGHGGSM